MKIFPRDLEVGDYDGFLPKKDLFHRSPIGEKLTSIVTRVDDPLVVAVDAPWGTGKTVFLKMWAGELRKIGIPVLYFDAFSADHADDAFLALTSEVVALAQQKRVDQEPVDAFVDRAVDVSKSLMSGAGRLVGKAAVRVMTAGALSVADVGEEYVKSIADDAAGLAEQQLRSMLSGAQGRKDALKFFRDELEALPALMAQVSETQEPDVRDKEQDVTDGGLRPLVFIVDELDRCTPPFALDLLERMKHVFSVPNVHFVLGVHLHQLENTVRSAYGLKIEARIYLQKFIHLTVPLTSKTDKNGEPPSKDYIAYLFQTLIADTTQADAAEAANEFLSEYAERHNVSLRTIERIYSNLVLCFATIPENRLAIGPLLAGLAILKTLHPELFLAAKRANLHYSDIEKIFGFQDIDSEDYYGGRAWMAGWWRYACDPNASDELVGRFGNGLTRYRIHERKELLPTLANRVLDAYS